MALRYWEYPDSRLLVTFIVGGSMFTVLSNSDSQEDIWEAATSYATKTWGAKYTVKWHLIMELSPEVYEDILSRKWFDIEVD